MTEESVFATVRLTLGLSARSTAASSSTKQAHSSTNSETTLDRRKRKRNDDNYKRKEGTESVFYSLRQGEILTPETTPLPKGFTNDVPLLAFRYLPISIAGDGAFSRTILAKDILDPRQPMIAIKAMKPGFDPIGRQEYRLLRRIQNLPMPKNTTLAIVRAQASFSASSTFHIVLEALEPGPLSLPECPHQTQCRTSASCPARQDALRKVAAQLLLALSVLHDQMGHIHADLKPANILRCQSVSPQSMKLKLIDLGNAVPMDRVSIYYSDYEIQSMYYRAPEVILGLPFTTAIDIFSLGLILAELLLDSSGCTPSSPHYIKTAFPTSPPKSRSPQPSNSRPLLSSHSSNRRAFIDQVVRLFGPLPSSFRSGKFWSDPYIQKPHDNSALLSQRFDEEGVDPELSNFLLCMLDLNPTTRVTARDALRHEWIVGPLLGYWAVLGFGGKDEKTLSDETTENTSVKDEIEAVEDESLPSAPMDDLSIRRNGPPRLYDFSRDEDEEEEDEVILTSSPTRPLPFIDTNPKPVEPVEEVEDDDEVILL